MEKIYIDPVDGRKSFYKKCYVIKDEDREILYSYETPIILKDKNGHLTRLWDGWSMTTGRHINAFVGLNKKEFLDLDYKEMDI